MLFLSLLPGLLAVCAASPLTSPAVVHESRASLPNGWAKREALDRRAVLPMRIALTQSNLHKGEDWLMEVSHPESEKYGNHWSTDDIVSAFAPSQHTVDSIKAWLNSEGIESQRIEQSTSLGWLTFHATVDEAEALLNAKYHVYDHEETGTQHVACDSYSVPAALQNKIDFITPTLHFDVKLKAKRDDQELSSRDTAKSTNIRPGSPSSGNLPKVFPIAFKNIIKELKDCDKQITPNCLRALYKFPPGISANPKNSYGIVEYTPQAYVPSDLDLFFKNFSTSQVGNRPILDSIDNGVVQQDQMGFQYNGESNLDLEYAMALVYPQKVTLYQVGDLVQGASFNNFLDGIDKAYCTTDGGDDPTQDGIYSSDNCGKFAATKVISTSYGYNEADLTPAYERRQCNEYMKLGLQGVSVLYSSGDYGVAGNGGQCIAADGSYQNGTLGGRFNPVSLPIDVPLCHFLKVETNIFTTTQPEKACETVIYSGGGFSNVFPLPTYQSGAVSGWFQNHNPTQYTAAQYNNSMQTRGYPDISANGANYVVAIDGTWSLVYGTSASSPTLGSILTLINEARIDLGKSSIGFINPVAYSNPNLFNDITEGGNQGCNTPGFSATTGWDPVTGLGTPIFPKMLSYFLKLK